MFTLYNMLIINNIYIFLSLFINLLLQFEFFVNLSLFYFFLYTFLLYVIWVFQIWVGLKIAPENNI